MIRQLGAAILAALLTCALTFAANAQDVLLTARDGSLEIEGTLIGYDGEFYRVETEFGNLTVDGEAVVCEGFGCPDLGAFVAQLTVAGAAAPGATLLPALLDAFARSRGWVTVREIESDRRFSVILREPAAGRDVAVLRFDLGSAADGIAALTDGRADLALTVGAAVGGGPGPVDVLALQAIVPARTPTPPLAAVPLEPLVGVFSGEAETWEPLGGPEDVPLQLHLPRQAVPWPGPLAATRRPVEGGAVRLHEDWADLDTALARGAGGIGLLPLSQLGNAVPMSLTGACARRLQASRVAAKAGDWPLVAPVLLHRPQRRAPRVLRDFRTWLEAPAATAAVRAAGYLDFGLERSPIARESARLLSALQTAEDGISLDSFRELAAAMQGAERLSVSLRFEPGAIRPDAVSSARLDQVARALEAGLYDGQELLVAGFSDGQGPAGPNQRISQRRADRVLALLTERAPLRDPKAHSLRAVGFGEALPLACDDTDWGRRLNRRVELWVRPAPE